MKDVLLNIRPKRFINEPRLTNTQNACGFTLVEMLIAIAVLGIMSAIVVPHMLQAGTLGVQAATRAVIADILHAQSQAIAHQSEHKVIFDLTDNSYLLTRTDASLADIPLRAPWKVNDGSANQDYETNFSTDTRFNGIQIIGADFGGLPTLIFDDFGSPTNGGTIDLRFNGTEYQITVAEFTGRVTVQQTAGG